MNIIQAIVLGIIQGLTEFLPISSSAHLIFLPDLLGWKVQSLDFDIFLHAATLLAVIIYFRKDLLEIGKGIISKDKEISLKYKRLVLALIAAFAPLLPFVIIFKNLLDSTEHQVILTLILFIIFGIPLLFIEKISKNNVKTIYSINWKEGITIGLAQCFALFSGISRSGITIIAGMFKGLTKEEAKRFTFLLSIPTIGASFAYELLKVYQKFSLPEGWINVFFGSLAALVSGIFAIKIMMEFLKTKSLKIFGIYRIILGIILLLYFILK
jgi:undecaprenyl-diphosphatase